MPRPIKRKMSREKEEELTELRKRAGKTFLVIGISHLAYSALAATLLVILSIEIISYYGNSDMPWAEGILYINLCVFCPFILAFLILCFPFMGLISAGMNVSDGVQYERCLRSTQTGKVAMASLLVVLCSMAIFTIVIFAGDLSAYHTRGQNLLAQGICLPAPALVMVEIFAMIYYSIGIRYLRKSRRTFEE